MFCAVIRGNSVVPSLAISPRDGNCGSRELLHFMPSDAEESLATGSAEAFLPMVLPLLGDDPTPVLLLLLSLAAELVPVNIIALVEWEEACILLYLNKAWWLFPPPSGSVSTERGQLFMMSDEALSFPRSMEEIFVFLSMLLLAEWF